MVMSTMIGGAVVLALLVCTFSEEALAQSDDAHAFFEETLLVDGISFPFYREGTTMHRFFRNSEGKFDMAEYRAATGVGIAVWDIRNQKEMVKMVGGVDQGPFINGRVIRTFADVEAVQRDKQHGWMFYTQVPWPLQGSIQPIEGWYRDGLRMFLLVYGSSMPPAAGDELGTGSSGNDSESGGLTQLGKEVIAECNRLGIIVDVSHCSRKTTLEAAQLSTMPVTSTHSGCEAVTPARRNKSDEEIRAIAKTGGVFGITPIKFMLNDDKKPGASMSDFIEHLEHAIKVAGIDHVGIASDIKRNGVPEDEVVAYTCPELNSQERWLHVYDALKAKGYSDEDQAKIFGGNYQRVFRAVLK